MSNDLDVAQVAGRRPNWFKRIGWLVLIWVLSVTALLASAFLFRMVMGWAGLTTGTS